MMDGRNACIHLQYVTGLDDTGFSRLISPIEIIKVAGAIGLEKAVRENLFPGVGQARRRGWRLACYVSTPGQN
jgi:hypothetical protein